MHPVQTRQNAGLRDMTRSVTGQIGNLSAAFELRPENLIRSGTPENVGPVVPGGVTEGRMDGFPLIRVRIAAA